MNVENAKKVQITDLLKSIGFEPILQRRNDLVYYSPLRDEKTPSFHVEPRRNLWKDFGSSKGGSIIDLVCELHNCTVSEALTHLESKTITHHSFSFCQPKEKTSRNIQVNGVKKLENQALIQYLNTRGINLSTAQNLLQEAYYSVNEKQYFALCLPNDSNGYELRNKYFKGGTSPKDITTIKGVPEKLNVFEGFMDYLSALEHYSLSKFKFDTVILNSASLVSKLKTSTYSKLNYFGDNDPTGDSILENLRLKITCLDQRKLYRAYKDFNEYLCRTKA